MTQKILVVDDEKLLRLSIAHALRKSGFEVGEASDADSALEIIRGGWSGIVLLDIRLPGMSGIELLRILRDEAQECLVIMMTAFSEVREAVESIKLGAFDYLIKPVDMDTILVVIARAIEHKKLEREVVWRRRHQRQYTFDDIVGQSVLMKDIVAQAKRVAGNRSLTILLLGETGTGKDLFAQAIHFQSDRSAAPFVTINCSVLPESLLESELFGYEKGAFTDARASREGLFELADGGTVYLDEIAEMKASLQVKLLRLIEDKTFRRLGGRRDIDVDVRIIAATNRDVEEAVKQGQLREDLYYRINVVPIHLPSLRERREDIPLLAGRFVKVFCEENHRAQISLSPDVIDVLVKYDWPGNVRELKNLLERIVILEREDVVGLHHLPQEIVAARGKFFPRKMAAADGGASAVSLTGESLPDSTPSLYEVERQLIVDALRKSRGSQVQAAKLLGISRDTLRYRIKKYGIEKRISW